MTCALLRFRYCVIFLIAALLALSAGPASAGFIDKNIQILEVGSYDPGPPSESVIANTIVGSQFEYDANFDFIDIGDQTITVGNNSRKCFGGFCPILIAVTGEFLGFKIIDFNEEIAPILDVSIGATSFDFVIDSLTFSENEIFIGFQQEIPGGYVFGDVIPDGFATLNVTFAADAVPEPGIAVLFLAGLFSLMAMRRLSVPDSAA